MRLKVFCTLVLFFSLNAGAEPQLYKHPFQMPGNQYPQVFQNTLVFGHSISSNLMYDVITKPMNSMVGLPYIGIFAGALSMVMPRYSPSPGQIIAEKSQSKVKNKAKGWGMFGYEDLGLGKMILMQGKDVRNYNPYGQKLFYADTTLEKAYREATAIVGIDAFYMGVILNDCSDYNVYRVIGEFIEQAYQDGKVVVLGNFPDEKFNRMDQVTRAVITGSMDEGWKGCMGLVNLALDRFCKADHNCYLVNLEEIVNDLDKNEGAVVQGRKYNYNELRPGGANLSPAGAQLIIDKILEALNANPPAITEKAVQIKH